MANKHSTKHEEEAGNIPVTWLNTDALWTSTSDGIFTIIFLIFYFCWEYDAFRHAIKQKCMSVSLFNLLKVSKAWIIVEAVLQNGNIT